MSAQVRAPDDEGISRSVILLAQHEGLWTAEVPDLLPDWQSESDTIHWVVREARLKVKGRIGQNLKLRVAEGTTISRHALLDLIVANGDATGLDLSRCDLSGIDLRPEAIAEDRSAEGEWISGQTKGVNLGGVILQRAKLAQAQLQSADLTGARLDSADLGYARLQGANASEASLGEANLRWAELQGADLFAAHLSGAYWFGSLLDRTRMLIAELGPAIGDEIAARRSRYGGDYKEAAEAYLSLKNNFVSLGYYQHGAWAYVKEQRMEKAALWWLIARRPVQWGALVPWALNWLWDALTGYGETPQKPVILAAVVMVVFAVVFAAAGNITPDFAGDPATAHGSHNLLDALTHSIGAFATIGFNTLEPLGWGARLLTAIESALGISLFALFIFTLGNRMSRS